MVKKSRTRNRLTAKFCEKTTQVKRHADGGNLYLVVELRGKEPDRYLYKYWSFIFKSPVTGKQREMSLGPFGPNDVTLKEARKEARKPRKQLRKGKDPIEDRKARQKEIRQAHESIRTFKWCRDKFIAKKKSGWRNEKHIWQWTQSLDKYAKPILDMPVNDIARNDVLRCLELIWTKRTETATRVRQRIEAILDWAAVNSYREEGPNPAAWAGNLEHELPAPKDVAKVTHRPSLSYKRVGDFMARLRAKDTLAAKAIELQILTACRPGEVYSATWDEIDLKRKTWVIPSSRMKGKVEHEVPLSKQAVRLLKSLPRLVGNDYIFPGLKEGKPLNTASGMKLIKELEPGITAHGFRSTFRVWAAEQTNYPRQVAEHALAHKLPDKVEAIYARTTLLPQRRLMMQAWSDFCDVIQSDQAADSDNVVTLRGAK